MKKIEAKLDTLTVCAPMLNYKHEKKYAVMNLKDGGKTTTTLNIFETPEEIMIVNISNVITMQFDSKTEFEEYMNKKFKVYESDKEMYQDFTGMDEETWNEWNK